MYEAIAFEFVKIETDINQIIDVHYSSSQINKTNTF
jgi:hypothetical protein